MTNTQIVNKALCIRYPFVKPRNVKDYDYSFTILDFMPTMWYIKFGRELLESIREVYITMPKEIQDDFYITEIKEKYGELRIYFSIYDEYTDRIANFYREESKNVPLV